MLTVISNPPNGSMYTLDFFEDGGVIHSFGDGFGRMAIFCGLRRCEMPVKSGIAGEVLMTHDTMSLGMTCPLAAAITEPRKIRKRTHGPTSDCPET